MFTFVCNITIEAKFLYLRNPLSLSNKVFSVNYK